uniref:Ig-like domain-containing protein n=1 Tax=Sarcophilus harrisii TaxID=9305 RepID=A0A7N4PN12_SARHA
MLQWTLLLVLGLLSRQTAIAKKSVVEPRPSWTPILEGEAVTLICHGVGPLKEERAWWYKNQQSRGILSTNIIQTNQPGEYRCQTQGSTLSDPVNLVFSSELFSPPDLKTTTSEPIEGTPVNLSCETQLSPQRLDTKLYFSFTRDGMVITSSGKNSHVLQIPAIQTKDSGSYRCEAKAVTQNILKQSNYVKISVKSGNLSSFNSSEKISHLSLGLIVTQFIVVVLAASALLFFFGPWSKSGIPQRETLPVQLQTT